jgi:Acyl-CoA dehydrogenase, N-terminal domain
MIRIAATSSALSSLSPPRLRWMIHGQARICHHGRRYLSAFTDSTQTPCPDVVDLQRFKAHAPITRFTEDEEMTRDAARHWAQEELKPIVRDMDNEAKLRADIVQSLFDCGFMGMVSDSLGLNFVMLVT